tara:strand:- start:572 stop:850 length:279 start_codon:yes stop_codon:yes gene_type:complete
MDDYSQGYTAGFAAGYLQGSQATRISIDRGTDVPPTQRKSSKKPKRKGKSDPKMSRALKKANEWGRTKSGKLRKGVSQGDIMSKAHQLRRKM